MPKVIITITDNPNGTIDVAMDYQPHIVSKESMTGAQKTAMSLLAIMKREATGLKDTVLQYHDGRVKNLGGKLPGNATN